MATTRLMPVHTGTGQSVSGAVSAIIDYVENPEKTDYGRLIYGYACDTRTAGEEFILSKRQYAALTGRKQKKDVIAYHLRQSFVPGEITPEEANQIGRELAQKLTKGRHAFIVCTHIDQSHVHNHVIVNSTDLSCTRKFRNLWGSAWVVRRISDRLCLEHGLSIVENPQPSRGHYGSWLGEGRPPSARDTVRAAIDEALERKPADFDAFLSEMEAAGFVSKRRGDTLSFLAPGQERYTRLRESTLGGDYTEDAIRERILGLRISPPFRKPAPEISLLIDIQSAVQSGKGPGYERWAKVFNLKQLARAVSYLKEHGGMSAEDLRNKAEAARARFQECSEQVKSLDSRLSGNAEFQKMIIGYFKTRDVYAAYRKAGYSKKFLAGHEREIQLHKTAKAYFDQRGAARLPSVSSLREEYGALLNEKKNAWAAYRQARTEMRELAIVQANVDALLGPPPAGREQKNLSPARD